MNLPFQSTTRNKKLARNHDTVLSDFEVNAWGIKKGEMAVVTGFNGVSDQYIQRMREIGIDQGAAIKCLNHPPFSAPRQFQICDGVFSLDMEISKAILVEILPHPH